MSSENSLFPYDKEQLLHTLERFDEEITVEDVTDSVKGDNSRYIHTSFLEVLLECVCSSFVKNDAQREILLTELCRRLSESKVLDQDLLLHTLPLRKQMSRLFFDFIKKVSGEVIPDAELDFSNISFLEENGTSFDNLYKSHFEELQEIGRGGFGIVCKARNNMTSALYAIKKIFFNYKNDSRLRRVIREAKNIAALNHPNVVHYNNAWTESPSPDDEFHFTSSDDSSSNSDQDDRDSNKIFCSDGASAIEVKQESYSSESTYCSRLVKSNKVSHSTLKKCKEVSFNEYSSDSVIFADYNSSYKSVDWTVGSETDSSKSVESSENDTDSSKSVESSENDTDSSKIVESSENVTDSSKSDESGENKTDSRKCFVTKDDSEGSRNSFSLNVKAILYIQMEYCNCDLRHWLDERAKGNPLPFEMDVTEIFINILNGVAHIHSKGIIHRDLKPQNIFYSESGNTLKIGDFGLATLPGCSDDVSNARNIKLSNLHSANIGTLPYAAPEQIKYHSYDSKVDIYSLGIILIELLNTFSTIMEFTKAIDEIKKDNFPNEMKKSPTLMNLVKNLVNETPDERMSAKEILDYLQEDSKVTLEAKAIALREKEIFLNEREKELRQREAKAIALLEKEIFLNEREKELGQREATINEMMKKLEDLQITCQ